MDIKQIRSDYDSGVPIRRATVGDLLVYAEQMGAVLAGRQQAIGALNMRIAELEQRPVAVPQKPHNPAAHDWATQKSESIDLSLDGAAVGLSENQVQSLLELSDEFMNQDGQSAIKDWIKAQPVASATIDSDEFRRLLYEHWGSNIVYREGRAQAIIAHIDARIAAAGMADNRDAERYRFLQGCWLNIEHPVEGLICQYVPSSDKDQYNEDALDAAIDTAMAAAEVATNHD